ncbi:MAG: porin [Sulfuricurvum sp.]|uniref:porin n=1 Tax=Sulfuricurvum sp. TaxID=2025608 RepID=UPI0026146F07|nr:porin [Sulfuricurvum sp.]MDD5159042.1 porin [Sulfuricurvum sp.]
MKNLLLSSCAALVLTSNLSADEITDLKAQLKALTERLESIETSTKKQAEQTNALTSELINVQNATSFSTVDMTKTEAGLGAAASKIYYSKTPLSIGGYGEMFYSHQTHANTDQTEVYRFVPYIGYKFSDNIILNSEIEFEHGGQEVSVEQLYLDFLLDPTFNVRLGHQVVPMGLINLNHEPVLFNTVARPDVEKYLIPSTWHETGLTVYGKTENFNYAAGAIVALDMSLANHDGAPEADSFGKNWIRDARRGGNESNSETSNLGIVARFDYTGINGLLVGTSLYTGKAGASTNGEGEGRMTIADIHAQYQYEGFKIKGLYTQSHLSNAAAYLGDHQGVIATEHPESARGGYINMEYNVLPFFAQASTRLPIFFQYENYNLATSLTDGTSFGNTESFTYGLNYFPHEQVVLKGEYTLRHNKNGVNTNENEGVYSFGLGFIF